MSWLNRVASAGVEGSLCALLVSCSGSETARSIDSSNIQNNNPDNNTVWVAPEDVQEWRKKFNPHCLEPQRESAITDTEQQIAAMVKLVRKSPIGEEIYNFVAQNDFVFCNLNIFENVPKNISGLNIDRIRVTGHIIHNDDFISTKQLTVAVHEWRHSWQGIDTVFSNRSGVAHPHPDAVTKSWMREADASAISILFAWDMSQKGYPEMWQSALADKTYGNIARVFEKELMPALNPNPQPQDLARATRAAFHAWLDDTFLTNSYYDRATEKSPDNGQAFTPTRDDIRKLGQIPGMGKISYLDENDWKKVQSKAQDMYNTRQRFSLEEILPPVKIPELRGPRL